MMVVSYVEREMFNDLGLASNCRTLNCKFGLRSSRGYYFVAIVIAQFRAKLRFNSDAIELQHIYSAARKF